MAETWYRCRWCRSQWPDPRRHPCSEAEEWVEADEVVTDTGSDTKTNNRK